jgi:hypothetical protein
MEEICQKEVKKKYFNKKQHSLGYFDNFMWIGV